jgi:peptide-methionine (S)-S-oxide reductase
MHMFFGNLFGGSSSSSSSSTGGGGVFGTKINYNVLDHPGPELGTAAEQGQVLTVSKRDPHLAVATFAGGCFWGLELAYQRVPGVVYTAVGYTQGAEEFPTYGQVCSGTTGHTEALTVYYDPQQVSYEALLDTFFTRVDPTTVNGQGNDRGRQYRTGVYFHTPEQEATARSRFAQEQQKYKRPIASELLPAKPFWPAEKYHQQYLENGGRFGQPQDASKGATDTIRCYG